MDRITLLIDTLKQQYQQKETSAVLLQTVNALQAALLSTTEGQPQHLGTAKIAVMMPVAGAASLLQEEAALSVKEQLAAAPTELAEALSREPIRNLKKAIGINDRFLLIQELFEGNEKKFEEAIKTLDAFGVLAEASFYVEREIKSKPTYQKDSPAARLLDQLINRRFS
ncbi:MAG: hypothetical protein FJ340_06740 [Sphingomonadales bacterium]|nr:hypothetical protein [Sphingomonadales bacterium]